MHFVRRAAAWALVAVGLLGELAFAGGGPENLLLVVNQNSDASKTIANHYIRMRNIPPVNVLYLDWRGDLNHTTGEDFREKILKPITTTIEERRLAAQIDYVVYSCDFPWRVDFRSDFKDEELAKQFRPVASLTGATYLWTYVRAKSPAMVMPTVNWYVPEASSRNEMSCKNCSAVETRGFRARRFWQNGGIPTSDASQGQTYMLSTMLGVTVERGNTVDEIIKYLSRAVAVDATHPSGTFYFMKSSGVRSKVRHDCFPGVVSQLQAEGAQAVIQNGTTPEAAESALGIMTGTSSVEFDPQAVRIAPGAICEHFTSGGGEFIWQHQTKLSEWLRAGAAGASGTVFEPYAIQAKFPLPSMHLHYFRGASLAEAFYQSVSGPYQLLVVGDPLCQPWAKPPQVKIKGIEPDEAVSGVVRLEVEVMPKLGTEVRNCELFIDGRLIARFPHDMTVPLNTASLPAGEHEIRLVASTSGALEFRGRSVVPFRVASSADDPPAVRLEVTPQPMVAAGANVQVKVQGPEGAERIEILQNHRRVGVVEGNSGSVEINSSEFGRGPVSLVARVVPAEDGDTTPAVKTPQSKREWFLVR